MPLPYTLYTSKELLKVYAGEGTEARKGVTENGLTRAMKATGFRQVANGESLDLGGTGKRERLWGLGREGERLRTATGAVVKAQYTKEHANDRPTGGRANATDPRTRTQ